MSAARLATIDRVDRARHQGRRLSRAPPSSSAARAPPSGRRASAAWAGPTRIRRRRAPSAPSTTSRRSPRSIGTTTAVMILFDEGKIRLDDHVSRIHPRVHRRRQGAASPSACCSSTAPGCRPAATSGASRTRPRRRARAVICDAARSPPRPVLRVLRPRRRHARLRRRGGHRRAARRVPRRARLRAARHDGHAASAPTPRCAAASRPPRSRPPRGYPLRGEVHDENAYALGGVAGHAGLFSTASDLSIFAQMMLNGGSYNGDAHHRRQHGRALHHAARRARARSAGTPAPARTAAASTWAPNAYGHTGFTGTSLWIDPGPRDVRHPAHQPRARRQGAPSGEGHRATCAPTWPTPRRWR